MSKFSDEKIETKTGQKNFHPMSSRQQILYLLKESNSNTVMEENAEILLDYHKYYQYKKEKHFTSQPQAVQLERAQFLNQALKEFTQVKKNIYIDRKKYTFTDDEAYVCTCLSPKFQTEEAEEIISSLYENKSEDELFGCGRGCLNKMVSWECVEHLCPSGEGCRNRRFQMHQYADVYPVKTLDRGYGLNAGNYLPKGTFVMQYIGEIFSVDSEYGQKRINEYKNKTCTYLMSLSKNEVIDPTYKGNLARFINHSCEPNCETQKWHVLGEICVGIFTLRDILPNEELTFNYRFNILKTTFQKCLCGAPSCRGYLGIASNNDLPVKGISSQILCAKCKHNCKSSEIMIVCDTCKKVYHRACTKKKVTGNKSTQDFICTACIKKIINAGNNSTSNAKEISFSNEKLVVDESIDLEGEELRKIQKKLNVLSNIGARLFWDFRKLNLSFGTSNKIELKVSGTSHQIELVKEMIGKVLSEKEDLLDSFSVALHVPKIFVRKIIGHQNRNLINFISKYNVDIEYDQALITDDIFPIQESSTLTVKGKETSVKAVENEIKVFIYNLKVLTIFLMSSDYLSIKGHICHLKAIIDPADLRLRKEYKAEKEIKHAFYYIPNNNKDLVIIGFDSEIQKGEKMIKEFILRQNTLEFNYSLCFLCPNYLSSQINVFRNENKNLLAKKNIMLKVIDPLYARRHVSVQIEGKWKDIVEVKSMMFKYFIGISNSTNQKRPQGILEFQQYIYNQEHKLLSKNLKNYFLDTNSFIKTWDVLSEDVYQTCDTTLTSHNWGMNLAASNSLSLFNNLSREKEDNAPYLKKFLQSSDRDTRLNYLLHLPKESYRTVFGYSNLDVIKELANYVQEAFKSFNNTLIAKEKEKDENISPVFPTIIPVSTTIDNIQNTLLNKLNSLRNENNITSKYTEEKNLKVSFPNNRYEHLDAKEGIHSILSKNENLRCNEQLAGASSLSEAMNISYNFSKINQMNINININNLKDFLGNKRRKDSRSGLLNRKIRQEKQSTPPYYGKKRVERELEKERELKLSPKYQTSESSLSSIPKRSKSSHRSLSSLSSY